MGWESDPLVYAVDSQGALAHVDSVANGAACGCVCPSCGQPLVAKNAGGALVHHFAHRSAVCRWAAEAAVIQIVRGILAEAGSMHVEGAGYLDMREGCWFIFPPDGELRVTGVSQRGVDGRQAPALAVSCVDEGGAECGFALVAVLSRRMTEGQVEELRAGYGNVLAIDFRSAYASMRDREGRHFSRSGFLLMAQDRAFLESALMGGEGSEVLRWLAHPRRDAAEVDSEERYAEELEEEWRERLAEFERMKEEVRLENECGRDSGSWGG